MLTSVIGRMKISIDSARKTQRGVSLVELLIVLSIIAMVAGVVIINAPPARSELRDDADRIAAQLDFAVQEAITSGALIGILLEETGYSFYLYRRGEWRETGSRHLAGARFGSDYAVSINLEQQAKRNELVSGREEPEGEIHPQVIFSPTGETTAFSIGLQDRQGAFLVSLNASGKVEVTSDERNN